MNGLQMLLKALGISIDPQMIEAEFHKLRVLLPQFILEAQQTFKSIDSRLTAIEHALNIRYEKPAVVEFPEITAPKQ